MTATRIVFLNTSILTCDGEFSLQTIALDDLLQLLSSKDVPRLSAIGHASTAQVMTELLGEEVTVNRIEYCQLDTDIAVVFKLNGRPPEGAILSRNQIEEIGYSFKLLIKRA
jgi:hypothetical protein